MWNVCSSNDHLRYPIAIWTLYVNSIMTYYQGESVLDFDAPGSIEHWQSGHSEIVDLLLEPVPELDTQLRVIRLFPQTPESRPRYQEL